MMKFYDDKRYNCQERSLEFAEGEALVNRHAATLVLNCLIKLLDLLIPNLDKTFEDLNKKKYDKVTSTVIKRLYAQCAKTYISDFLLFSAMNSSEEDIFY